MKLLFLALLAVGSAQGFLLDAIPAVFAIPTYFAYAIAGGPLEALYVIKVIFYPYLLHETYLNKIIFTFC